MTGPTSEHVKLGPLPASDLAVIVDAVRPGTSVEELHARTGGSPFFVAQALRAEASADGDESLLRLVHGRVGLAHQHAERFLSAAALIGLDFDPWLAGDAVSLDPTTIDAVVDTLEQNELLLRADGERRAFAHGLVAEAMRTETPTHERRALPLRIAEILQTRGAPAPDWISHLIEAGPLVDPHTLAVAGAEAAAQLVRRGRPGPAVDALRAILARPLAPADRVMALRWYGLALFAQVERGAEVPLIEASELALEHGLDAELVDVALAYGRVGPWPTNDDNNRPRLLTLAKDRCPADRPDLRARIEARLASFEIFTGPLHTRTAAAERAIALAETSGDIEAYGDALNAALVATACPSNLEGTRQLEADIRRLELAGLMRSDLSNRPAVSTFWLADGEQFRADVEERRAEQATATRSARNLLTSLEPCWPSSMVSWTGPAACCRSTSSSTTSHGGTTPGATLPSSGSPVPRNVPSRPWLEPSPIFGCPLRYTLLWLATEADDDALVAELYDTITPKRVAQLPETFLGGFGLAGLAMTAHVRRDRDLAGLVLPALEPLAGQMLGVPWSGFPSADLFLSVLTGLMGDADRQASFIASAQRLHGRMGAPSFDRLLDR